MSTALQMARLLVAELEKQERRPSLEQKIGCLMRELECRVRHITSNAISELDKVPQQIRETFEPKITFEHSALPAAYWQLQRMANDNMNRQASAGINVISSMQNASENQKLAAALSGAFGGFP